MLCVMNSVTYLWTVYFIFLFGQRRYDRFCDNRYCYCNKKMYAHLLEQHVIGYKNREKCHDDLFKEPFIKADSVNSSLTSTDTCSMTSVLRK